jgi:hypothetical protein
MKQQLSILLFAALLALSPFFAHAQKGNRSDLSLEERVQIQTDSMESRLDLTADQVPKVYDINLKYAKIQEELRESAKAETDRSARMEVMKQMKANSDKKNDELAMVLNNAQYEQYIKQQQARRKKIRGRMKNRRSN